MGAPSQLDRAEIPQAVRQVAALMTAWLAEPDLQPGTEAHCLARATLDEAVGNAAACMPLMAGLLGSFVTDLADAAGMTPLEFWRPIAVRMSSHYPEGGE